MIQYDLIHTHIFNVYIDVFIFYLPVQYIILGRTDFPILFLSVFYVEVFVQRISHVEGRVRDDRGLRIRHGTGEDLDPTEIKFLKFLHI